MKFSVGSCCCKNKEPVSEELCGDHCNGANVAYFRTTFSGNDPKLSNNLIDLSDHVGEGSFPKYPFYVFPTGATPEEGRCFNETDLRPWQDIIKWRLRDEQNNVQIMEGYCRSLIPIEEFWYNPNIEESEDNVKYKPVTGINLHKKPVCWSSSSTTISYYLAFGFDEAPFLRVFYRRDDYTYVELNIEYPPDSPINNVDIRSNLLVATSENDPFIYRYQTSGETITRRLLPKVGTTGHNFRVFNDKLCYGNTGKGRLFELDETNDKFRLFGGRIVNKHQGYNAPAIESSRIYHIGDELYFVPKDLKSSRSQYCKYNNGNYTEYSNPYTNFGTNSSYYNAGIGTIDGNDYVTVNRGYIYDWTLTHPETAAIIRPCPETGTSYDVHFYEDWCISSSHPNNNVRYAKVWRWDGDQYNQIPFERILYNAQSCRILAHKDEETETVFAIIGFSVSPRLQIFKLDRRETDPSTWTDPDVPEFEFYFKWFQSFTDVSVTVTNDNILTAMTGGELFVGVSSSATVKTVKRYDKTNDLFVDIVLPVFGPSSTTNWYPILPSTYIRDIVKYNDDWYMMTDTQTLKYFATENEEDDLLTNGEWKTQYYPMQIPDRKINFLGRFQPTSAYTYIYVFVTEDSIYTQAMSWSTSYEGVYDVYEDASLEDVNSLAINVVQYDYPEGSSAKKTNLVFGMDSAPYFKHLKWMDIKDDDYEAVLKTWCDVTDINTAFTGPVTNVEFYSIPLNPYMQSQITTLPYSYTPIYPEGYPNTPNGTNAVKTNWVFDAGIACLIDGKPDFLMLKQDEKDNIWNTILASSGSPSSASPYLQPVPEKFTDWFIAFKHDELYFHFKNGNTSYHHGNKYWIDDESGTEKRYDKLITNRFTYSGTYSDILPFDYLCIDSEGVVDTFMSTDKAATDKMRNHRRLRKLVNREISGITDVFNYEKWGIFFLTDEEPYYKICKCGPNDGIPLNMPRKYWYEGNANSGHEYVITLDYCCFDYCTQRSIAGQFIYTPIWCTPRWKKIVWIPRAVIDTTNWEIVQELRYELDYDTKNRLLRYGKEVIDPMGKDSRYISLYDWKEQRRNLNIRWNPINYETTASKQIGNFWVKNDVPSSGRIPLGRGLKRLNIIDSLQDGADWETCVEVIPENPDDSYTRTNIRGTAIVADKDWSMDTSWSGSWKATTTEITHDFFATLNLRDQWYFSPFQHKAFSVYRYGYDYYNNNARKVGLMIAVADMDTGNVSYHNISMTDTMKLAGYVDSDWQAYQGDESIRLSAAGTGPSYSPSSGGPWGSSIRSYIANKNGDVYITSFSFYLYSDPVIRPDTELPDGYEYHWTKYNFRAGVVKFNLNTLQFGWHELGNEDFPVAEYVGGQYDGPRPPSTDDWIERHGYYHKNTIFDCFEAGDDWISTETQYEYNGPIHYDPDIPQQLREGTKLENGKFMKGYDTDAGWDENGMLTSYLWDTNGLSTIYKTESGTSSGDPYFVYQYKNRDQVVWNNRGSTWQWEDDEENTIIQSRQFYAMMNPSQLTSNPLPWHPEPTLISYAPGTCFPSSNLGVLGGYTDQFNTNPSGSINNAVIEITRTTW